MLSNLESDGPTSQSRMTKGTVKSINTEKEPDNPDDEDQFADSDCDDEDDKYRLQSKPSERKKVSETKRQDAAAFQAWLFNNRDTNMSGKQQPGKANDSLDATMMGHHWSKKIIANPRQYQIELFERAKEKNTIVVLDTGSGKTLIAALLLKHVLRQELDNRAQGKPKKVAFFVVEKVALCFQQWNVLKCNLEYPVAKFYGDMGGVENTKEYWDTQFDDNMVVVCTAAVLLNCLNHGFIGMRQINLLIFDEAHHTKKNHPFAKIIKHHYQSGPNRAQRPRILGMTASPVDTKTKDMRSAAMELEGMMSCEIATISDEALEESTNNRNLVESREIFGHLQDPEDCRTQLWEQVNEQVGDNAEFKVALDYSSQAASTLGTWCADRFWKLIMTSAEVSRFIAKTHREMAENEQSTADEDAKVDAIHRAYKIVDNHMLKRVARKSQLLSPKVESLVEVLEYEFTSKGARRCIVFVEQRFTACMLVDLLRQPGIRLPGVIPDLMIGKQSAFLEFANMSFKDQVLALRKFKAGDTNCLIATPVAEEGIDIPDCDLIIRFDIYNSMIQYIQSKGRARQLNSRYISMIEQDNYRDELRILQAYQDSNLLRRFCYSLPDTRKVQEVVDMEAVMEAEINGEKAYEVPSTGAKLSLDNSMSILAAFTSTLNISGDRNFVPEYVVFPIGRKFAADVVLPEVSPVNYISGHPQRSKHVAKYSAAFEACMHLLNKGYIDKHLQPVFAKRLPAMRNARLAVSCNKKAEYDMLTRPSFWTTLGIPSMLYAMALTLNKNHVLGRPAAPLLLLSRNPMPSVPDIPLFFGNSDSSIAKVVPAGSISVSFQQAESLTSFTLMLFSQVFSKEFDATSADLPYFLAPSEQSHEQIIISKAATVNWDILHKAVEQELIQWDNQPDDFFTNKFAVDPLSGARKFVILGTHPTLRPADPTPEGVAPHPQRSYYMSGSTIMQYSNSYWRKAREAITWKEDQPVLRAEVLTMRRNFLDEDFVEKKHPSKCYLIPEPLRISLIPMDVVMTALVFPSIIHRIDAALIALEACSMLNLNIRPELALESFTKDSDNSDEHDEEKIDFQAGMGKNYERLEYLGDSFLKMATTISLYTVFNSNSEFQNHIERMLLICNQNLFNHAVDRRLPEYIRSKAFDRRTWYPQLKLTKGKAPKTVLRHNLSDKTIADVCEALIGAAYLTGEGNLDEAVRAVSCMVKSENHRQQSFKEYYDAYEEPEWQKANRVSAAAQVTVDQVAEVVGYRFKCPAILLSAFKHPSYPYEPRIPDYQRLEWLGDALLDMTVVDFLYKTYPNADPQWLTEHKSAMVSNQYLGCLAVRLSLQRHLLSMNQFTAVAEYVTDLEQAEELERQQAIEESRDPRPSYWIDANHPPKALADIAEALIGAIFVDSKYDYAAVESFSARHVLPSFADMTPYDTFATKHPVSMLSHRLQNDLGCFRFRFQIATTPCAIEEGAKALTETDVVCAFMIHGRVVYSERGKSGRYVKVRVAKQGLQLLAGLDIADFATEYGCTCQRDQGHRDDQVQPE